HCGAALLLSSPRLATRQGCVGPRVRCHASDALQRLAVGVRPGGPLLIGVPKEIKTREYRVGMTPAGVRALVAHGHSVLVETGAGEGSGISDDAYVRAGAKIDPRPADVWGAELVVKVKEPLPPEYGFFRENLIIYTYLHLAAEPELTRELARK